MRPFPSASRQRLAAALAAGALALGVAASPLAHAQDDDLKDRRNQVQSQIKHAQDELEHASKQAQRAAARLSSAQTQLKGAQGELATVSRQLAAAKVRDAQTQAKLVAAEARLVQARADLAAGREAVAQQRRQVTDSIVGIYEQGDPQLLAFTALVNAESLEDLTTRSAAEEAIVSSEAALYGDLREAEKRLKAQEQEVEAAAEDAEVQRRAAAVNLETTRSLHERAQVATTRVRDLVQSSSQARKQAVAARARDAAQLKALRQREARIKQLILAAAREEKNTFSGATDGFLNYPVNGSVTSPYGYRTHPIYGYWGLHDGTDFGAGCGQPLLAGAQGTVVETYYDSVYGNRLYLNVGRVNGANLTLVYNHLSGYKVGEGARVGRGDVVGYVGSTGWSTGCHLHFTVLRNGEPVDPMTYF